MKILLRIVLIGVLLGVPLLAAAGDDGSGTAGSFSMGAWGTDTSGTPDMVSEYEPDTGGPALKLDLASHGKVGSLFIKSDVRHSDDSVTSLSFDIYRMVRSHTSYTKLLHRLGHDPMTNLEGTSINGKVVFNTDHNPTRDYDMTFAVLHNRTELQLPGAEMLTFAVELRDQHREGHRQAFAVSHCDTCHVNSMSHPLNEHTRDGVLEVKGSWGSGSLTGRYTARKLTQGFPSLTMAYDDALHPELRKPVFDDRLQYDSAEGPLPVDLWPDIDKNIARLDLQQSLGGTFHLTATGVWSETENKLTGLKANYDGYLATIAGRLSKSWRLRWRGRVYNLDNDDFFVQPNQRVGIAGPAEGRTYAEMYGIDPSFMRKSALNRTVIESAADLSWRLGRSGTLKLTWSYQSQDRDSYVVTDSGDTTTTTNVLGISWRARLAKVWHLDARYQHAEIDNPFMALNQQASTLVTPPAANPWVADQYYQFQDARIGDGTASPSSWDRIRLAATVMIGHASNLTASYNWWSGDNSDGNLTDWSRTNQSFTIMFSNTPATRWTWFAGYAWNDSSLDAPTTIPIFDG
ncbi:MAG: hypothetical protein GXP47_09590 [Acidobacteria bacterium]|nr:hypothetical protein [Acidobacteriota bacterium]